MLEEFAVNLHSASWILEYNARNDDYGEAQDNSVEDASRHQQSAVADGAAPVRRKPENPETIDEDIKQGRTDQRQFTGTWRYLKAANTFNAVE